MSEEDKNEAASVAPTQSLFASVPAPVVEDTTAEQAEPAEAEAVQADSPATIAAEAPADEPAEPIEDTPAPAPEVEAEAEPEAVADDAAPAAEQDVPTEASAEVETVNTSADAAKAAERKSVISQIATVVKTYNIPLKELVDALGGLPNPRKGTKAPITHKDKNGNSWSGRGKTPNWLKGKNPDDYRV